MAQQTTKITGEFSDNEDGQKVNKAAYAAVEDGEADKSETDAGTLHDENPRRLPELCSA